MMSNTVVDQTDAAVLPEQDKEQDTKNEQEFRIKHSYELMDEDLLGLQDPSTL